MGQSAYTEGYINFKDEITATKGFTVLYNWVFDAMNGKLLNEDLNGDYSITDLTRDGSALKFKAISNRVQNLEWQMENFMNVAKKQEGCMNFEASILTEYNMIYWDVDDEKDGEE